MNKKINIFRGLDFRDSYQESSFEILSSYKDDFKSLTNGELLIDIKSNTELNLDNEPSIHHKVYVICPKLGNYRIILLEIKERGFKSKFPVDIYCYIDNKLDKNIEKENFITTITEIFERLEVKKTIEDLFHQSLSVH